METSILSLNSWLLPFGLSSNNQSRIAKLLLLVEKLNPDIITLQEVWLTKDCKRITTSLHKYHTTTSMGRWFNKSGLMTLTKEKPLSSRRTTYKTDSRYNPVERIMGKGALVTQLKRITIANTHLYNPMFKKDMTICQDQIKTLIKLKDVVVLCGDFNMTENKLTGLVGSEYKICDGTPTLSTHNPLRHKKFNRPNGRIERLDYVIPSIKSGLRADTVTLKKPILSDHYAIFSTLRKPYKCTKHPKQHEKNSCS